MYKSLPLASRKNTCREDSTTAPKTNQCSPVEQSVFERKNVRCHQWGFGDTVAPQLSTRSFRWAHHSKALDLALGSSTLSVD